MKPGNHRGEEEQRQLRVKKKKKEREYIHATKEVKWEYEERGADGKQK